jgi:hypothetical protein
MRRLAASLLILGAAGPAGAGFKMGLGKAVARQSVETIDKAEPYYNATATGESVAQTMASCGPADALTVLPVDLSDVRGIVPLGNTNPPGHTFPSDHTYYYMNYVDPLNTSAGFVTSTLRVPGRIRVVRVTSGRYLNAPTPTTDYGITFYVCKELRMYITHISTLDAALLEKAGGLSGSSCMTYGTGGTVVEYCSKEVNIPMEAGDVIGTVGHKASAFDFGANDYRIQPLDFVSPQRSVGIQAYTTCPIDYFDAGPKAQMEARLGRFDGLVLRTQPPLCGGIMFDVRNTAAGRWYKPGAPDSPEDPHLALVPDNVNPAFEKISSGTSVPQMTGFYLFSAAHSGRVNRSFSEITADGQVYCIDSFYDPVGHPAFTGFRALLTMPTPTTLRIQRDASSTTCGAGPWTMSGAAVDFQR